MIQVDNDGKKTVKVSFMTPQGQYEVQMDIPTAIQLAQSLVVHAATLEAMQSNVNLTCGYKPGDSYVFETQQHEEPISPQPKRSGGGFESFMTEVEADMANGVAGNMLPENSTTVDRKTKKK